jgi:hypothetical protein
MLPMDPGKTFQTEEISHLVASVVNRVIDFTVNGRNMHAWNTVIIAAIKF